MLDWEYFWQIESEYAASLDRISTLSWDLDEEYGGNDLVLPDGYDLLAAHAVGLDVRTGDVVQTVTHTGPQATVATNHSTWEADAVVVTLPLGVLKGSSVTFDPPLPAPHAAAIARLGFGPALKLGLEFDAIAWPADRQFLAQIGTPGNASWIFSNLAVVGSGPILVMEAYDEEARRLESAPLETAVVEVIATLRRAIPGLPEPVAVARSSWNESPFAGGGFSFWATGSGPDDIQVLATPASERLVLAGEHTNPEFPGTVHGALKSGQRAARQLMRG